jgi:hypothetical protein
MKYRKKPVVIEAVKWTGNNTKQIFDFCDSCYRGVDGLYIITLEGSMRVAPGDFIIKTVGVPLRIKTENFATCARHVTSRTS